MNKKLKTAWVKALRSGKYEQGVSALQNGVEYCCLGVLCDVAHRKFGRRVKRDPDGELAGCDLSHQPSYFGIEEVQGALIDMNDNRALSFGEIATWIVKNVKAQP